MVPICVRCMVISAANQSRTKTAVKRIENDDALDILHDFKYNYDNLCSHLRIKDENIDIEPPEADADQKVNSFMMENILAHLY